MCMIFVFLKYKNSSDFFNDVRTCTRSEIFLRLCSWISVMIFNFRLLEWIALFILFLNLNIGIWIHILFIDITFRQYNPKPRTYSSALNYNAWTNGIFLNQDVYTLSITASIVCCGKSRNFESWLSQLMPGL